MDKNRLEVFRQHRSFLFGIAYRMLGSVTDAEDMVQETFLRWQQVSGQEVHSPRAFLATIISRLCLNYLESARVQREEYVGPWLPEPLLTGPAPDPAAAARLDESLSMAFLVLLETLTPAERAVFLLREVFDYDYGEIAGIVGVSEVNCRQILRRARQHVAARRPRFDPSPQERERLMRRFVEASLGQDMQGLLALLSEDIVLYSDGGGKVAAALNPIYGRDRVARFILGALGKFVPSNLVTRPAEINGQPGVVNYVDGRLQSTLTVDVAGGAIRRIYIVSNPDKLHAITGFGEAPLSIQ